MTATATLHPPAAPWVKLDDLEEDPYPIYRKLQEEAPVHWIPVLGRYLVTGYDACHLIEQDPETFSSDDPLSLQKKAMGHSMIRKDDPEHLHERRSFGGVLRPKAIKETWAAVFTRTTAEAVERYRKLGPGVDFHAELATPLASENLRQILGFENVAAADVARWSTDLIAGAGNYSDDPEVWARSNRSAEEIDVAINEMRAKLSDDPNASLLSQVLAYGLPEESVNANIKVAIAGGFNEPRHILSTLTLALLQNPDQLSQIREENLWNNAFDEALRWVTPLAMYVRTTTRDTFLGGYEIPAGSGIAVGVGAANRDPERYVEPEVFNVFRERKPHLAFGNGPHFCAGSWVARSMIVNHAIPAIFENFPGLRLDPEQPAHSEGWAFRGPTKLPLLWDN